MTFGEMAVLTKRFNQIKGASQQLRNKRFEVLMDDIVKEYPPEESHGRDMYLAIMEEMEDEVCKP